MRFSKWHALGNDYLLVERADAGRALDAALVTRLCDVHCGIGSDGLLEVVDASGTGAEVVIWNPDGSIAELSGNGTRIAARWLAERSGADEVSVTTGGRVVRARSVGGGAMEQEIGAVTVESPETIEVDGELVDFTAVSVGNPHAVVERLPERADLLRLGPRIEHHERFPARTNVQFVQADGDHDATAVVWERGAGETLSSGTSACAVAAAMLAAGRCASPVRVHMPGGTLSVAIDAGGVALLTGPVERICDGTVADELLRSAGW